MQVPGHHTRCGARFKGVMHLEDQIDPKFQELAKLGAGDFEHLDGILIDHLNGTMNLLKEWGANSTLLDAGLFHAVYGTAGFDANMVSVEQRQDVVKVIGTEAEEIVYQYCACDRQEFFSRLSTSQKPKFKNRFNGEDYYLSDEMLKMFCELTAANEIEIAIGNPSFKAEHGCALNELFLNMTPYLSKGARLRTEQEFGKINS